MKGNMDGKAIKSIWWNGADGDITLHAEAGITLVLCFTYHGDRDEIWVIEYKDGIEKARHNTRHIASIEWA